MACLVRLLLPTLDNHCLNLMCFLRAHARCPFAQSWFTGKAKVWRGSTSVFPLSRYSFKACAFLFFYLLPNNIFCISSVWQNLHSVLALLTMLKSLCCCFFTGFRFLFDTRSLRFVIHCLYHVHSPRHHYLLHKLTRLCSVTLFSFLVCGKNPALVPSQFLSL